MSEIKVEDSTESATNDAWLSYWSNPKIEVKKEEEEEKPDLATIQSEKPGKRNYRLLGPKVLHKTLENVEGADCEAMEDDKSMPLLRKEDASTNQGFANKDELKIALEHASVSEKVADLCEYQCPKCERLFKSRSNLCKHFRESKHATGFKGCVNNYLVKIIAHECSVCSQKILCDKTTIVAHISKRHNHSLKDYFQNTKDTNFCSKIEEKKISKLVLQKAIEKAPVSKSVSSQCKYQCTSCNKVFATRPAFSKHMKKTKHATLFRGDINNFLIKIVAHKCLICSKKILCDGNVILCHLIENHKINSLKEYVTTTLAQHNGRISMKLDLDTFSGSSKQPTERIGNLCKFSCQVCSFLSYRWEVMVQHLKSAAHVTFKSADKYATTVNLHKCYICLELVLCDCRIIMNHLKTIHNNMSVVCYKKLKNLPSKKELYAFFGTKLKYAIKDIPAVEPLPYLVSKPKSLPDHQVTRDTGNCCFFKCLLCYKSDFSYSRLCWHSKYEHQLKHVKCKIEYLTEARYHKCHICSKVVLCDNQIIMRHIRMHKISLTRYNNEYVLKSSQRVLPTFKEYSTDYQVFEKLRKPNSKIPCLDARRNDIILPSMLSSESEESDCD